MIIRPHEISAEMTQAEVCVIGSGAGGAVVAKELAEAGFDVVILEEGDAYSRRDFSDSAVEAYRRIYRNGGFTVAIGRPCIPLPMGRCLGGTTVVNMGTCFRTPDAVLESWATEFGLEEASPAEMHAYFDRVEELLGVAPVPLDLMGRNAHIVKRGMDKLGWSGGPLRRNAPGCAASGVCVMGCPTNAKQAMHLSYIPRAEQAGARIYIQCRAEKLLIEHGRVAGVMALAGAEQAGKLPPRRLTVRAPIVILAAGTIYSPLFLLKNKLCTQSRQVGRNLHIHPASRVMALMDEEVNSWEGVPQSYYCDQFIEDGIMMEGVAGPPGMGAFSVPHVAQKHHDLMQHYGHIAAFGAMITDTSAGTVRLGLGGRPLITYQINQLDTQRTIRGAQEISRIFFAAGATAVWPSINGVAELTSPDQIETAFAGRRAEDLEMMAFHPTGTCRMGGDPQRSVVDNYGEAHDVPGFFIADGSIFPTPLGVNPQISIMAFATRTAAYVAGERERYLRTTRSA